MRPFESAPTIRRRLQEVNLRRPATGPFLTRAHRVARLPFAQAHLNCTVDFWKRVMFTNETRVSLFGPDCRQRVWRRPEERFFNVRFSP